MPAVEIVIQNAYVTEQVCTQLICLLITQSTGTTLPLPLDC
jgi:hypothetical protein